MGTGKKQILTDASVGSFCTRLDAYQAEARVPSQAPPNVQPHIVRLESSGKESESP